MATCDFYLKIDGVDITDYIAAGGVKWSRNDVEDPDAGRTLDGLMHRNRVATKIRMDITTVPLLTEDMQRLQQLLSPVYITVEYPDLVNGAVIKTMYSNNISTNIVLTNRQHGHYWSGCTFPLIER